jgi:DNA-binding NarL/FixJ family response regulator
MRLIVADDSLLFREGLARLLVEQGFKVIGQSDDAEDLLHQVDALRPDVALVDIRMPPTFNDEGLQAARTIGERHPAIGVVVLSQYIESSYALRLLQDGGPGRGYLLKDRVSDLGGFRGSDPSRGCGRFGGRPRGGGSPRHPTPGAVTA